MAAGKETKTKTTPAKSEVQEKETPMTEKDFSFPVMKLTFPITPEPPIKPPTDPPPSTKGVPEAELEKFEAQRRLDRYKANQAFDATISSAQDTLVAATGVWEEAQAKYDSDTSAAKATAETSVQQAVLDYRTSVASGTTPCPEKSPPPIDMMIYWLTLYNSVATANATYQTSLGTAEATLETARGVYEAAVKTDNRTREAAGYTKGAALLNADKTFWESVKGAKTPGE